MKINGGRVFQKSRFHIPFLVIFFSGRLFARPCFAGWAFHFLLHILVLGIGDETIVTGKFEVCFVIMFQMSGEPWKW